MKCICFVLQRCFHCCCVHVFCVCACNTARTLNALGGFGVQCVLADLTTCLLQLPDFARQLLAVRPVLKDDLEEHLQWKVHSF